MLDIRCPAYLNAAAEFSACVGAGASLMERLTYLATYASGEGCIYEKGGTRCELRQDGQGWSFYFTMYRPDGAGGEAFWFNGGLVYHGPGIESFSVELVSESKPHWSVHT